MGNYSGARDRTATDDILDYAMGAGMVSTGIITAVLISLGFPTLSTIFIMSILGGLWVFTITPHLVAYWMNTSVDSLLGIHKQQPVHLPLEQDDRTGKKNK